MMQQICRSSILDSDDSSRLLRGCNERLSPRVQVRNTPARNVHIMIHRHGVWKYIGAASVIQRRCIRPCPGRIAHRPCARQDGVSGLTRLRRRPRRVSRSQCWRDTSCARDFGFRGDAVEALVAPLLARGVFTVVASHWAVRNRWTRVLIERFSADLAAGLETADALDRAQSSLRTAGVPARLLATAPRTIPLANVLRSDRPSARARTSGRCQA